MKKVFALTMLLLSTSASAINHGGWYVKLEPFYADITDRLLTNSIFAIKVPDPAIQGDFKEQYHRDQRGDWGGYIELGFDFPNCYCSRYGVALGYEFLDLNNRTTVTNDSRTVAGLPVLAPAEFIDITDEAGAKFSHAQTHFKQEFDKINLLAKRYFYLPCCNTVTVFGGLQYFHLKENLNNHYEFHGDIEDVTVTNLYNVHFDNKLDTAGPHLGARWDYLFYKRLGVNIEVAGSLLYGESSSSFHNTYHLAPDSTLGETTNLSSLNHNENTVQFVPAIFGKIGIDYQLRCRCATLVLEAGYKGEHYFNAVNDVAYQQLLAGDDINSNCNYQDISIVGPYFSVTLHG